ncbi:MAG: CAP domain-containing protein [Symploca sp. SIO2E9]|nr:CAP domain-containing protein [Symploca sp. SIO2E9]
MSTKKKLIYFLIPAVVGFSSYALASELTLTARPINETNSHPPNLLTQKDYIVELLQLTNAEREKVGSPPLKLNAKLFRAAQRHAEDMAENNFFSHTGFNGSSMSDRLEEVGYSWKRIAENISAGQSSPEDTMERWMNSSGHRGNILNPQLKEIGIGYATNSRSQYRHYWVQVFATHSN